MNLNKDRPPKPSNKKAQIKKAGTSLTRADRSIRRKPMTPLARLRVDVASITPLPRTVAKKRPGKVADYQGAAPRQYVGQEYHDRNNISRSLKITTVSIYIIDRFSEGLQMVGGIYWQLQAITSLAGRRFTSRCAQRVVNAE
jgi:hypothetical protein